MNPLQSLLINAVWVFGLAALLATINYLSWLRVQRQWGVYELMDRPVAQTPIYLSLTIFCLGLALSELLLAADGSWWRPVLLVLFVLYFSVQTVVTTRIGRKHGWEKPASK